MPSPIFPNPQAEQRCRAAWKAMSNNDIMNAINQHGLGVKLKSEKTRHFKIIGGKRPVELYASTGTVVGEPKRHYGSVKCRGMLPERAIERIVSLARHGH